MRLDREHRRLLEDVLHDLESVCSTDRLLAERLSVRSAVPIPALALAKLKRGDNVGDERWESILTGLQQLLVEERAALGRELDAARYRLLATRVERLAQFGKDARSPGVRRAISDELDLAARAYDALRRGDIEARVPWKGKAIIYRLKMAPDKTRFEDQLDASLSELIWRGGGDLSLTVKDRPRVPSDASGYRKMMDWNIAAVMPVFLLFPFFLTHNRRQNWGVIPYGRSRRLRLVMPRRLLQDLGPTARADALSMDEFNHLLERKPKIHGVVPYSAQQIIIDAVASDASPDLRAERVYEVYQHMMVPGWSSTKEALNRFLAQLATEPDSWPILAFNRNVDDVDDHPESLKGEVKDAVSRARTDGLDGPFDDLEVCTLVHDADVPVGIGYSLPAYDWIAQNGNFDELRRAAIAAANEPCVRKQFEDEGIDVDSNDS